MVFSLSICKRLLIGFCTSPFLDYFILNCNSTQHCIHQTFNIEHSTLNIYLQKTKANICKVWKLLTILPNMYISKATINLLLSINISTCTHQQTKGDHNSFNLVALTYLLNKSNHDKVCQNCITCHHFFTIMETL